MFVYMYVCIHSSIRTLPTANGTRGVEEVSDKLQAVACFTNREEASGTKNGCAPELV
jgi:hypothetical protein